MRALLIAPNGETVQSWDDVEGVTPEQEGRVVRIETRYDEHVVFLGGFCVVLTKDRRHRSW